MITADPQLDDVKSALKLGAYDFIGKPLDFEELHVTIQNALEASRLRTEVQSLRGEVRRNTGYHEVVAVSPKTMELMSFVQKVAASEATTILIQGESGTGKDLIAKTIHYESTRQNGPFVAINCSAIPETLMEAELFGHERGAFTDAKQMKKGLFETANGGTLVPRRNRRTLAPAAGQAAARAGRSGDSPGRRRARYAGGCARHRRLQSRPGKGRARRPFPPGSLLPAGDHRHLHSAAARAHRRHSAAGRLLHRLVQPQVQESRSAASPPRRAGCCWLTTGRAMCAS